MPKKNILQVNYDAEPMINEFERRMVNAFVPVSYSLDDIINWIFPDDWIKILKDAYPLVEHRTYERSSFTDCTAYFLPVMFDMTINVQAANMCVPRPAKTNWTIKGLPDTVRESLTDLYKVHGQWQEVRNVVGWFNDKSITPAAVKHYWPSMAALCPSHQKLQEAEGRLHESTVPPHEMQELMWRTATLIASATMLPATTEADKRENLTVSFGEIDMSDPQHPQPRPAPYGAHRYGLL